MARTAPRRQQQQEELVLGVLLSANPSSTYARRLLRPFHKYCSAGRAAALRTIRHLRLDRFGERYQHQLWLLEAADQATALTVQTSQIPGLLAALLRQQEQQQKEQEQAEEDEHQAQRASAAGGSRTPNTSSSSRVAPCPQQPSVPVVSANKPRGAQITHLAVVGEPTLAITQQLEALLDVLPATQHLQQIVLCNNDDSVHTARATNVGDEQCRAFKRIAAAVEDAGAYHFPDMGAFITGSNRTDNMSSSSSSRAVTNRSKAGPGCRVWDGAAAGAWRSSCHTLVADLRSRNPWGGKQPLTDLGPLLGALQQQHLQVLYLKGLNVVGIPLFAAALQPLRALHMDSVQGAHSAGVVATLAALPHLRHLGVTNYDGQLTEFSAAPGKWPHLTSLDLSRSRWAGATVAQVCSISGLRELDLSGSWCAEMDAPGPLPDCIAG
jgi:hypothetical protein